jgi:hypothetical protein
MASTPISAELAEKNVPIGGRRLVRNSKGIALPALMAMTEHRAVGSVIGYFQAGGVTDNPAAQMLDDGILNASSTP